MIVIAPPEPIRAKVVLVGNDSATAGLMAIPPADPASAVVVIVWLPSALSVRSSPPVSSALFSISARLSLRAMFSAKGAPPPTPPPPPARAARPNATGPPAPPPPPTRGDPPRHADAAGPRTGDRFGREV